MRASRFLIATLKEIPSDAEVISHQLMLRAGMIRRLASGLYTWLPLGLRVLRRIEAIVRDEMNRAGAQEVLMPMVQPAELWQESHRWEKYGPELLRLNDRHGRPFCLGPTHEEVITDLLRNEVKSYKQLPATFYQIQTKFRDEIRPRFGVMRAREFIMKDAYSFHITQESLQETYDIMHRAYCNIFTRIGLDFRPVLADTGSIGGSASHEFHVLADSGEDAIAVSNESDYAANVELAEALAPAVARPAPARDREEVATPGCHTIEALAKFLSVPAAQTIKTLIVLGENDDSDALSDRDKNGASDENRKSGGTGDRERNKPLIALVLRGDHELNEIKAEHLPGVAAPLTFAPQDRIERELGCGVGSLGPVGLDIPVIVDRSAAALADFVCGANKPGYHLTGVNWERDLSAARIEDLRKVVPGDPSPDGRGTLDIKRGIEVGHIFQLGKVYSQPMNASVLDESGREQVMTMGCYGIGVTRIVAAAIEQNHDERGIIWPEPIAPFQIALVPVNMHKSPAVAAKCEALYHELQQQGFDVLFMDEAKARLGAMLADIELMGIPHRIVVSDRGLENGTVEYKGRRDKDSRDIGERQLPDFIKRNC